AGAATLAMLVPGPGARASTRTGGAQLWVARYNDPGGGDDDTRGIGVSPDGSTVFVTGAGLSASGSSEWATVAYDAVTGQQKWLSEYAGTGAQVQGLAVSPDGSR